jgi:hypothetical protein
MSVFPEASMAAKAALILLVLATLLGGCGLSAPGPKTLDGPQSMPLTAENVATVRAGVDRAKATAQKAGSRDEYVRYARQVYAAAVTPWSAAATTETALASAKAGNVHAREYLTVVVYDAQLQAAMEGVNLSVDDWKAIYVGSGIMTDPVFSRYAAMSRGGKALP